MPNPGRCEYVLLALKVKPCAKTVKFGERNTKEVAGTF